MSTQALDAIDRRMLERLQADSRVTNQALSQAVGLSPSPCLRRQRQLEEAGIITGYVSAFVRVRLASQEERNLAEFERAVETFPEIMECYLMTGDSDYQLRVLVGSLAAFEDFLRSKLTRIPGVTGVTSSFALRPIVYRTAVPVR